MLWGSVPENVSRRLGGAVPLRPAVEDLARLRRLRGELDMRTPIEVEEGYYADQEPSQPAPARQESNWELNPGRIRARTIPIMTLG